MYSDYRSSAEEHMMQGQLADFMYRVYGWMTAALMVTAAVAYYVSTVPSLYSALFKSSWMLIGLFIAQIGLVIGLTAAIGRLSYAAASILFMVYAASLGLTLSAVFLVYEVGSIYLTFFVTAGMFGAMCVYGYLTKADLTKVGSIATMALFGLVIGLLVNMFFQSKTTDYILSGFGVLIFTALTAYDAQKIKQLGYQLLHAQQDLAKIAVLGALTLYLDFINLFLFLLRFLGKQRD
jgi:FtsH-binding integral membrane protein